MHDMSLASVVLQTVVRKQGTKASVSRMGRQRMMRKKMSSGAWSSSLATIDGETGRLARRRLKMKQSGRAKSDGRYEVGGVPVQRSLLAGGEQLPLRYVFSCCTLQCASPLLLRGKPVLRQRTCLALPC